MDLSGIIFVVLALAWAFYLIPKAVKHHDDIAPARSVDRFSTAMRVLGRRDSEGPGADRDAVASPSPGERVIVPSRPAAEAEQGPTPAGAAGDASRTPRRSLAARRAAARAAARRRRRVTGLLVLADAVVVTLAALAVVPWWAVAIPVALTVLYLALCRRQVRRENDALWAPREVAPAGGAARRAVRVDAAYGSVAVAHDAGADDDTVQIPVTDGEAVPVVVETADGGSLWDPLPVTLPTYVNKARAARTVRTIDLGGPGTWSSGRDESDSALVDEPATPDVVEETVEPEPRRAVGS